MDLHNINTEEMKLRKTTYPMGLRLHHRAALTLLLILSLFLASCSRVEVPAQYSETAKLPAVYPDYTNVTVPVCSLLGIEGDEIYKCSADLLSSNIPKGETAKDWWSKYMFSNAFHPTPYGHVKMSEIMLGALAEKGWN